MKSLGRLWLFTLVTNLAGGWIVTALVIAGFPTLRPTAIDAASFYIHLGSTWRAFALALIGGMLITLMTHLQHATDSDANPTGASGRNRFPARRGPGAPGRAPLRPGPQLLARRWPPAG